MKIEELKTSNVIPVKGVTSRPIDGECTTNTILVDAYGTKGVYNGAHEFTPTREEQTIEIKDLMSKSDIKIKPIPSNYGLITYDGSSITVS